MDGYMTSREVAAYLAVKPQTLDYWASQRKGPPYVKVEGSRRYSRADLDAWLEARKVVHQ